MGNKQANNDAIIKEEIPIIHDNGPLSHVQDSDEKQVLIRENEKIDVDFKIFIGIDFGTDGCGLAYAVRNAADNGNENRLNLDYDNTQEVVLHMNFKDAHGPFDKSRTSVLLDDKNKVQSVGGEAANVFVQMKNNKGWKLFERFKMNLYEAPNWKSKILSKITNKNVSKVNLKETITPTNGGEPFPSKDIFVAELQKLRTLALSFLRIHFVHKKKISFEYTERDIQWILTVPAIWSDYAKDKMREWAQNANITDAKIRNQLKIVYEPDCASMAVQYACNKWDTEPSTNIPIPSDYISNAENGNTHNLVHFADSDDEDIDYSNIINANNDDTNEYKKYEEYKCSMNDFENEEMKYTAKQYTQKLEECIVKLQEGIDPKIRLNAGDIYCLVDCGGGTCDIACHRTTGKYSTEEILHPTGGRWGSMNIDTQFETLLNQIFGESTIKEFKHEFAGMWLQLKNNFCNDSKASFYNDKNRDSEYHNVTLPANFSQFIHTKYNDDIDKITELLQNKCLELFQREDLLKWEIGRWNGVTFQIHNRIFINYLFEKETITPIMNHLSNILIAKEMQNCKYIILVGGLANSRYYQQRIYNKFGRNGKIKILVPEKPQLAVVEGAARMGLCPHYIQSRILPKSYGIRIDYATDSLPNLNDFDPEWLNTNTYSCTKTNKDYVKNIFSAFVSNEDRINFNDKPIIHSYFRRHREQEIIDIKIFSSTKSKPLHVLESESNEIGQIQLLFNTNKNNQTKELEIIVEFCFNDTTLKVFAYPKNQKFMKQEYRINYLGYS